MRQTFCYSFDAPSRPSAVVREETAELARWMALIDEYGQRCVAYCSQCNRTRLLDSRRQVCESRCPCPRYLPSQEEAWGATPPPEDAAAASGQTRWADRADAGNPVLRHEAEYTMVNPSTLLEADRADTPHEIERLLDLAYASYHESAVAVAPPQPSARDDGGAAAKRRTSNFCACLATALVCSPFARLCGSGDKEEEETSSDSDDDEDDDGSLPVRHWTPLADLGEMPELPFESMCVLHHPSDLDHPERAVDLDSSLSKEARRVVELVVSTLPSTAAASPPLRLSERTRDVLDELKRVRILLHLNKLRPKNSRLVTARVRSLWHECWDWQPERCLDERGRMPLDDVERVWETIPQMARAALMRRAFSVFIQGANRAHTYLLYPLMTPPVAGWDLDPDFPAWRFRTIELPAGGGSPLSRLASQASGGLAVLRNYALARISSQRLGEFLKLATDETLPGRLLLAWCFLRKVRCDALASGLSDFCRFVAERASPPPAAPVSKNQKKKKRLRAEEVAAQPRLSVSAALEAHKRLVHARRQASLKDVASVLDTMRLCLRCNDRDVSVVMKPCGHAYACGVCALRETAKCLVCSARVDSCEAFRMWYSVPLQQEEETRT